MKIEEKIKNYERVFKRYDIRGHYKKEIDELFLIILGNAIAKYLKEKNIKHIVLGIDLRDSSPYVKNILIKSLAKNEILVEDIGIGPTDYVAFWASKIKTYGLMITASHHEYERTGIKILDEKGKGLKNEELEYIKGIFKGILETLKKNKGKNLEKKMIKEIREVKIQKAKVNYENAKKEYICSIKRILQQINVKIDDPFLIDLHTSAILPIMKILAKDKKLFSSSPYIIHSNYTIKENLDPEPTTYNRLHLLTKEIQEKGKSIKGMISYDADGDRVIYYYNKKEYSGNEILYSVAKIIYKYLGCKRMVFSVDTSEEVIKILEKGGIKIKLSRVGDIFVSEECKQMGCCFSGEPNNHLALPSFTYYNSGLIISLILMGKAKEIESILQKNPLRNKQKEIRLEIKSSNNKWDKKDTWKTLEKELNKKEWKKISDIDGIKVKKEEISVLIRKSGTKEIIKIEIEYKEEEIDEKVDELIKCIKKLDEE